MYTWTACTIREPSRSNDQKSILSFPLSASPGSRSSKNGWVKAKDERTRSSTEGSSRKPPSYFIQRSQAGMIHEWENRMRRIMNWNSKTATVSNAENWEVSMEDQNMIDSFKLSTLQESVSSVIRSREWMLLLPNQQCDLLSYPCTLFSIMGIICPMSDVT